MQRRLDQLYKGPLRKNRTHAVGIAAGVPAQSSGSQSKAEPALTRGTSYASTGGWKAHDLGDAVDAAESAGVDRTVVDDHKDACVMLNQNVLRVHWNWPTAVHAAGMHSVLTYHPLSLKKVRSQILRGLSSRTIVDVWQACAIKKGYKWRLSEKQSFLARTASGEVAFASNAAAAELDAPRAARRAVYERARQA